MNTRTLGELGERIAEAFVELKGYKVIKRNFRFAGRELDILALKDDYIVAIEVKMRRGRKFGQAVEAVDKKKVFRLKTALAGYLQSVHGNMKSRIDLVVIDFKEGMRKMHVHHIEGIY